MDKTINDSLRDELNIEKRKKLKNKDFTLIASNCTGGFIYHDLGLQFRSPFINLWLKPQDYIKYLKNIEHYMNCELSFIKEEGIEYPIGLLDDVKIYFMHYKSEEEAKEKWIERTKRINLENLYILFTERDGCTYENLKEFDSLPYKNKVVFTHITYEDIKSACYIKGFENEEEVGFLHRYKGENTGERFYDDFDYVSWFNN